MTKIYVVQGETGAYDDYSTWIVTSFRKEEDAKLFVDKCNTLASTFGKSYTERRDAVNPYDPNMRIDYSGVEYLYFEVELQSSFKEL